MQFRPSTLQDIEEMTGIANDAVLYLKEHNINQWQKGYPTRDNLLSDLDKGIGYVAEDRGRLVALCAVTFEEEAAYSALRGAGWLTEGNNYAVVHRMCVAADCHGLGYPALMFDAIETLVLERGAESVRIDTHPENFLMQRTISKAGFTCCGEILVLGTPEAGETRLAYEKLLPVRSEEAACGTI